MNKKINLFSLIILLILLTSYSAHARYCGKVLGKKINTYGHLSCKRAKQVYKAFNAGHTPKGWLCGQSVGGCGKGKQGFIFNPR